MSLSSQAEHNLLLAALPRNTLQRLLGALELVDVSLGQVLYESGVACRHIYFPTTAIVSLISELEDGNLAGIALVGNEGVVGIAQLLGGGSTPGSALVQSAGTCMRVSAASMKEEFIRSGPAMLVLLRYTQALMAQMTQTAVCNRHHSIDQQVCYWLLRSLDRGNVSNWVTTQEQIANMLGVRREGITKAVARLQHAGLIKYARRRITVLDRDAIESRACECYCVVHKEYERLISNFAVN